MISFLIASFLTQPACPAIDLTELAPEQETYVYRLGSAQTTLSARMAPRRSDPGEALIDVQFLNSQGGESPPTPWRVYGGVIWAPESRFASDAASRIRIMPGARSSLQSTLSAGETLELPVTIEGGEGDGLVRHQGDYIIRHLGCRTLTRNGAPVTTRQIAVESFSFTPDGQDWRLSEQVQVHDIAVDETWIATQLNAQGEGLVQQGYEIP